MHSTTGVIHRAVGLWVYSWIYDKVFILQSGLVGNYLLLMTHHHFFSRKASSRGPVPTLDSRRMNNMGMRGDSLLIRKLIGVNMSRRILSPLFNIEPISTKLRFSLAWIFCPSPSTSFSSVNFKDWGVSAKEVVSLLWKDFTTRTDRMGLLHFSDSLLRLARDYTYPSVNAKCLSSGGDGILIVSSPSQ